MSEKTVIRESAQEETPQVLALYPQAFPDEELRPLVSELFNESSGVLSLAGFEGDNVVAHVLFTICGTEGDDRSAALLGPLGVVPRLQGQGLGGSLVRTGLERLANMGIRQVFVLGDPAYYARFGFRPERKVSTPFPIPEGWVDAWQSLVLKSRAPIAAGRLLLPAPWMQPELWRS